METEQEQLADALATINNAIGQGIKALPNAVMIEQASETINAWNLIRARALDYDRVVALNDEQAVKIKVLETVIEDLEPKKDDDDEQPATEA